MENRFPSPRSCATGTALRSTGRCAPIRRKSGERAPRRSARRGEALVAGLSYIGARAAFLLLDLRVVHVVALALRGDAGKAPADIVLREALPGVAAAQFLGLGLSGFLLGLLRGLCLLLLALAERLFLLPRGLGRSALGRGRRLVGGRISGRGGGRSPRSPENGSGQGARFRICGAGVLCIRVLSR